MLIAVLRDIELYIQRCHEKNCGGHGYLRSFGFLFCLGWMAGLLRSALTGQPAIIYIPKECHAKSVTYIIRSSDKSG